jgi:NADH:ubiquinone oxidoreductase subunit 4 (subunit M)
MIAQKTFFGTLQLPVAVDFDRRETAMMLSMALLLIVMGLHPQPLLDLAQQTLDHFSMGVQP